MSRLSEIESAISQLPFSDAKNLHDWLEQWLGDQGKLTPAFLAPIEKGKADLDGEDHCVVRNGIRLFPVREGAGPVTPELIRRLLEEPA